MTRAEGRGGTRHGGNEGRRRSNGPDGAAALFSAITRPRNPENIIISLLVNLRPRIRSHRGAHRIYFIKPFSKLPAAKLSLLLVGR